MESKGEAPSDSKPDRCGKKKEMRCRNRFGFKPFGRTPDILEPVHRWVSAPHQKERRKGVKTKVDGKMLLSEGAENAVARGEASTFDADLYALS
jgi:hypothetical protein